MDSNEPSGVFPEHVETVSMRPIPRALPRFFYQRPDGSVFDCREQEAALLEKDLNRRHFRRWGYSDGTAYVAYLKDCGVKVGEKISYERAREIMNAAGEAEKAAAKGNLRVPILQEWVYPDNSVPVRERHDTRLYDQRETGG